MADQANQAFAAGQQYAQQFANHYAAQQCQQPQAQSELRAFWQQQMQEVVETVADPSEFKNHQLPLARIKKIMKSDEDVRMISAEAPVLFAKACEMFILELTLRAWNAAEENKRRTLQRSDVAQAITRTDIFDFLVDIVPRDELKQEGEGMSLPPGSSQGAPTGGQMFFPFPAAGQMPMDPMMFQQQQQQQQQFMGGMPGQSWPVDAGTLPIIKQQPQ